MSSESPPADGIETGASLAKPLFPAATDSSEKPPSIKSSRLISPSGMSSKLKSAKSDDEVSGAGAVSGISKVSALDSLISVSSATGAVSVVKSSVTSVSGSEKSSAFTVSKSDSAGISSIGSLKSKLSEIEMSSKSSAFKSSILKSSLFVKFASSSVERAVSDSSKISGISEL